MGPHTLLLMKWSIAWPGGDDEVERQEQGYLIKTCKWPTQAKPGVPPQWCIAAEINISKKVAPHTNQN